MLVWLSSIWHGDIVMKDFLDLGSGQVIQVSSILIWELTHLKNARMHIKNSYTKAKKISIVTVSKCVHSNHAPLMSVVYKFQECINFKNVDIIYLQHLMRLLVISWLWSQRMLLVDLGHEPLMGGLKHNINMWYKDHANLDEYDQFSHLL